MAWSCLHPGEPAACGRGILQAFAYLALASNTVPFGGEEKSTRINKSEVTSCLRHFSLEVSCKKVKTVLYPSLISGFMATSFKYPSFASTVNAWCRWPIVPGATAAAGRRKARKYDLRVVELSFGISCKDHQRSIFSFLSAIPKQAFDAPRSKLSESEQRETDLRAEVARLAVGELNLSVCGVVVSR